MKTNLKHVMLLYGVGCIVCAMSVVLMLYWRQGGITVPSMVWNVVGGLPWIAVAGMIVIWRSKELPKIYPLSFVFGVGTPFLVLFLRGLF